MNSSETVELSPGSLRAIVLDANAFGKGLSNLDLLHRLADLATRVGIETWVPEPVAWEWAEHLSREVEAFRVTVPSIFRTMQKGHLKATMPTLPPGGGEGISREFLGNLSAVPGITLVKLTGDSAIEGLRDQILQTGPGRRKDGVKTGASDSAWLRDVLRKAGGNFESVVLLSSDRDVVAACSELRVDPPRMLNIHDLNKTLFRFVSGPEGLSRRIALHFTKLISDLRANTYDGWVEPDIDLGHFDADPSFLLEDLQGAQFQVHGVTLRHLHEVLSVTDIGTASEFDEEFGEGETGVLRDLTLDAVVEFRADVDVSIYDIDADGEIQMDVHSLYDVRIIASLLIEISKGVISYCTPLANSRIEALEKPQRLEPLLTPWPAGPVFK